MDPSCVSTLKFDFIWLLWILSKVEAKYNLPKDIIHEILGHRWWSVRGLVGRSFFEPLIVRYNPYDYPKSDYYNEIIKVIPFVFLEDAIKSGSAYQDYYMTQNKNNFK